MRGLATGLLVLMAAIYLAASFAPAAWAGRGYVRAFAEAAMVGACADWFAVSALFRQPLGLPIPHTGIIPRNKARIGAGLGGFIASNFLTVEVLDERLRALEIARWGGSWLADPVRARRLSRRLVASLPAILEALPRDALQLLAGSAISAVVQSTPASVIASRALTLVQADGRARPAIDWAIDRLAAVIEAHPEFFEATVESRSNKWMPKLVDRLIAAKISEGLLDLLLELRTPEHPWRLGLDQAIQDLIDRLATDLALQDRLETLKLDLARDPRLHTALRELGTDLQARLISGDHEAMAEKLQQVLQAVGAWLAAEDEAQARLNAWARRLARRVIAPQSGRIGDLVAQVVGGWDTAQVVDKLELMVGKDLQYIRINGTLVGGLVGLAIYALSRGLPP